MVAPSTPAASADNSLILKTHSGFSLSVDKQYRSVPFPALLNYCDRLCSECRTPMSLDQLVFVFKFYKLTAGRGSASDTQAPSAVLMDLIDIHTGFDKKSSFFSLNQYTGELSQIRRVFISNKFFTSNFINMEDCLPPAKIVVLSNVAQHDSFAPSAAPNSPTKFYSWNTAFLSGEADQNFYLNFWRERIHEFESEQAALYNFRFVSAVEDLDEREAPVKGKRAPK